MLLKTLRKLNRSRFIPKVISLVYLGEIGSCIQALGIPVRAFGMSRSVPIPLMLLRPARLMRELQPDVVHIWMLLGGLVERLARCARVIWCIRKSNLSKTENKSSTLWVVKACALL